MKNKISKIFNKYNITIWLIFVSLLSFVFLSFYPGFVSIDGENQWRQVISGNIIKNHPFFSTWFWWLLSKIWYSKGCLCIFQILLISTIWTYCCSTLRTKSNFKFQIIYSIILCFIPIIFAYAITTWKDIIYSYNLLLLAIMFYIGIKNNFKYNYFQIFLIVISLIWINNYRYNGIIVVGLSLLIMLIFAIKYKVNFKKIISFIGIFVILFGATKLPELIMYNNDNNNSYKTVRIY